MSAGEGGVGRVARGHAVLIVEDDPTQAGIMAAAVRSRGDTPYLAGTVEEALAALDVRQYCYCLVDQQLPTGADDMTPMLGGGECVMGAIREKDGRLNARKCHVTPILVVTGYTAREDFVSKMYELGCDAFLSKPLREKVEVLLDRVREMTRRAGRGEHAACAELNRGAGPWRVPGLESKATPAAIPAAKDAAQVRLGIDGKTENGRSCVAINGEEATVRDAELAVLLKLAAVHQRAPDVWSSREALGLIGNRYTVTRLRESLAVALPEGFEMIEGDRRGLFRLNPAVVVERVAWEVLKEHPEARVRKVVERRKG